MSASEKLKTLNTPDERYPGLRRDVLEEALPEIIAVVEAAELVNFHGPYRGSQWSRFNDALVALNAKLSEAGK